MKKNKNILIVEDEAVIAIELKAKLLHIGHSVSEICASGAEALKCMETSQSDLVLMDIQLNGEMDGIETAELIRRKYNIPIIYMTAHSEGMTIERAKITEPYGYLLKPVNPLELQIAVEVALYKSGIDREKARLTKKLQEALEKVKLLSGMIPICASCKQIRNDKGYWEQIEVYIREHSEAEFSHGICPDCGMKLYPNQWEKIMEKQGK
jgi:CheY-like chemotaxis protein